MLNGRNGHAVSSVYCFCFVPLPSERVLIHKNEMTMKRMMLSKNYRGPQMRFTSTGGTVQIQTLR